MVEFQPVKENIRVGVKVAVGDSLENPVGSGKVVGVVFAFREENDGNTIWNCQICKSMSFENCFECREKKICRAAMTKVTDL